MDKHEASKVVPEEVPINRTGPNLQGDHRRVILKAFFPSTTRIARWILMDALSLSLEDAEKEVSIFLDLFSSRHVNTKEHLIRRYDEVLSLAEIEKFSEEERGILQRATPVQRCLAASYFVHEYSIETAALFNPSIVPHPAHPKPGADGAVHFVLSLRSTGEGHVSSVTFREGVFTPHGRVELRPALNSHLTIGVPTALDASGGIANQPSRRYWNPITGHEFPLQDVDYVVRFGEESELSQRVLYPMTARQCNGIEDARFVAFEEAKDGGYVYYATVTAYDGHSISPQLIETRDFRQFHVRRFIGEVQNKGMALFPRKVNGKYAMLSRQDDKTISFMTSDSVLEWHGPSEVLRAKEPWEMFKMGNCGSPLETPHGWLVITHGVGPLRRYSIGAALLDLEDPTRVLGRLRAPLLQPNEAEREGYVPNVVYTCGAMLTKNGKELLLPYAMSDSMCSFATFSVDRILRAMGVNQQ